MGGRNSGRRAIPTALKRHHQMPSLRDVNKREPDVAPIVHVPPAPEHMHEVARAEWERVAVLMIDVHMLTELDLGVLAAYCEAFATYRVASEKMAKLALEDPSTAGLVVRSPGGAAYLNPLQAVKQSALRDLVRYAGELGLTPAGRASIVVTERGGLGRAQPGAPKRPGADLAAKYNL